MSDEGVERITQLPLLGIIELRAGLAAAPSRPRTDARRDAAASPTGEASGRSLPAADIRT